MRCRLSPVQAALLRAVRALLEDLCGDAGEVPSIIVDRVESRPWASLTYVGERHELVLRLLRPLPANTDLELLLCELGERRSPRLPGSFVADVAIARIVEGAGEIVIILEVLTIGE
ncbi:MAG: hypothetical protein ACK4Z0_02190 [Sphingomonadaceae bacterium]